MKNSEIVERVKQSLRLCAGYDNDEESTDREAAHDYYHMRPRGDEIAGRSQVVSGDLSAMVEAVLAQMLDAFSTTHIVELDSYGESDDRQAALESDAVEWFVMKKTNGLMTFAAAIKDALLLRNGFVKVQAHTRDFVETRELTNVEPEAIGELQNIPGATVEVVKYDSEKRTARLKVTRTEKQLLVEPVAPENFVYLDGWHTHELQDIPICGERHVDPRSDLIDVEKFPKAKVDKLQAYRVEYKTDAKARDTQKHVHDRSPLDDSQETVEWYELYVLMDLDGDGVSERWRICIDAKGSELLERKRVALVPYGCGTAILNPHRLKGISLFDKLRQTQDLRTGLKRALMDNANTVTKNSRAYLDGKVEPSDLNSGRPNGDIRVRGVPRVGDALMNFTVTDLSQGILANLENESHARSELGGAALELATGNMQLNDRLGSQGLDRAYSVMEQLSAMFTKNIANTLIRSTFLLAHATLRREFTTPVEIKPDGRWQNKIPAQWVPRQCATIRVGMSPGERQRRAATLRDMLTTQVELAREGMDDILVNAKGFHANLLDLARVSDVPNPEQYYLDPESPGSVQALDRKKDSAAQSQQMQQALMSQALRLEEMGHALEKYRHDSELQFKYYAEVLGAEVKEAELVGKATLDLTKQQQEGERQDVDSKRVGTNTSDSDDGSAINSGERSTEAGEDSTAGVG